MNIPLEPPIAGSVHTIEFASNRIRQSTSIVAMFGGFLPEASAMPTPVVASTRLLASMICPFAARASTMPVRKIARSNFSPPKKPCSSAPAVSLPTMTRWPMRCSNARATARMTGLNALSRCLVEPSCSLYVPYLSHRKNPQTALLWPNRSSSPRRPARRRTFALPLAPGMVSFFRPKAICSICLNPRM